MIDIKPFKIADLSLFMPNVWSNPDHVLDQLTDGAFEVQTLWHDGEPMMILVFRNYWGRNWHGFFLVSKYFPPKLAIDVREHIRDTMIEKDAKRLSTHSVACKVLDDWHKFMGFKWEGCHEQMINDQDYNSWALMRGGN